MKEYYKYEKETFVKTGIFDDAYILIETLHKNKLATKQVGVIVGETGVGKTSLIKFYVRKHSNSNTELSKKSFDETGSVIFSPNINILHISAPATHSRKDLLNRILDGLGHTKTNGTIEMLTTRLKNAFSSLNIELVIIDELHKLLISGTGQMNRRLFNLFQDFLDNIFQCDFLLVGTESMLGPLKKAEEFNNRVINKVYINQYNCENKYNQTMFKQFVKNSMNPLPYGHFQLNEEIYIRLYFACNGIPRNLKNLVICAITVKKGDQTAITIENMLNGYNQYDSDKKLTISKQKLNPFDLKLPIKSFCLAIGWPIQSTLKVKTKAPRNIK